MIKEYSFLQDFTSIMKILYQYLKFGGKKLAKSLYAFIKSSIDDLKTIAVKRLYLQSIFSPAL